jgi:hypothetical protein
MGKGGWGGHEEWHFVMYNKDESDRSQWISFYNYDPSGGLGAGDFSTGAVEVDSWLYVTGTAHATSATQGIEYIYRNAAVHTGGPDPWSAYDITYANGTAPLRFGNEWASEENWFNGRMDEIRISNVTRSTAWIAASNYADSDTLMTYALVP